MKRIIYTNENGGTSIVVPAPHITDYEALAKSTVPSPKTIWDVPTGIFDTDEDGNEIEVMASRVHVFDYEIVDVSAIPSDRTLRNIWKHDTTASLAKIGVNMLKAKDLVLSEVRAKRNVALEDLDKQYAIATRTGADTALLDAQRTKLLNTTDALKALDVNGDGIVTPEEAISILGASDVLP
jgi:hypothetical protein